MWKYRNKKQKLWKNLEKKYGEPVLEEHEWDDVETGDDSSEREEQEDLDEHKFEDSKEQKDL